MRIGAFSFYLPLNFITLSIIVSLSQPVLNLAEVKTFYNRKKTFAFDKLPLTLFCNYLNMNGLCRLCISIQLGRGTVSPFYLNPA